MAPLAATPATPASADWLAPPVSRVLPRQAPQATVTVIPLGGDVVTTAGTPALSGGAIAGIVIGSVIGFLLLCWIFRCALIRQTSQGVDQDGRRRRSRSQSYYAQEIVADPGARRSRSRHHSHGRHHHHHSRGRHGSRSRSAVRVTSTTTAQMPPVVEPSRVYYGEKRHSSRRGSSSRYDY